MNWLLAFVYFFSMGLLTACHNLDSDTTEIVLDSSLVDYVVGDCQHQSALADCIEPNQTEAYYIEQANKYFDTLDGDADGLSIPNYSELVARWEWPPWLKLTGIGRVMMIGSDIMVTRLATPSTVPERDCRAFDTQPFARCRVQILYDGGLCPIYEEFSFNSQGEMTFIEAWSDQPGLLPMDANQDPWAEADSVNRLATKLPGLGNQTGRIDLEAAWMKQAARDDIDVAAFAEKASNFWATWSDELTKHGGDLSEGSLYGYGCGWKGFSEN